MKRQFVGFLVYDDIYFWLLFLRFVEPVSKPESKEGYCYTCCIYICSLRGWDIQGSIPNKGHVIFFQLNSKTLFKDSDPVSSHLILTGAIQTCECSLIGYHCTISLKCAKLVDEKNNRLFCCVSVRDFEPKILIKGVHLTN